MRRNGVEVSIIEQRIPLDINGLSGHRFEGPGLGREVGRQPDNDDET